MSSLRSSITQALLAIAVTLTCLIAATQWAAAMLGYQAALGAAWIDLAGFKLYAPWKLFVWWLAFDGHAPGVFARAGAVAAFGGIAAGLVAIGGAAWRASRKQQATTYGLARWADTSDVGKAGLLGERGVVLGLYRDRYLRHDGPEHVLPTLLTWPGSAIVHDIKGENWVLTAGWRAQFSHCLLFDPTNPLSARFNPLLEVRQGAQEVRDVQNIADILVDPEGAKERRDHWEKTAHALLTGAILHVLSMAAQAALALRWPVPSFLVWTTIAAGGAATVLSFAILAEYFPKEMSGRANAALNFLHVGAAFVLQCATGFIIARWPETRGAYPGEAHQVAMATTLIVQLAALAWFAAPQGLPSDRCRSYSQTA